MRTGARRFCPVLVLGVLLGPAAAGSARPPSRTTTADRGTTRARPESAPKPDFQLNGVRIAPIDIIADNFIKPSHWSLASIDLQTNLPGFEGEVRAGPLPLGRSPHLGLFSRSTRLIQDQRKFLHLPVFLPPDGPMYSRSGQRVRLPIGIASAGASLPQAEEEWPMQVLGPNQFLIVVLATEPNRYHFLRNLPCVRAPVDGSTEPAGPGSAPLSQSNAPAGDGGESTTPAGGYYYKVVWAEDPDLPPQLSPYALTWTPISHLIWDDADPADLELDQQRALVDWLHFGGQLIISGGAGATLLRQSPLIGPLLPADVPANSTLTLNQEDLRALTRRYGPGSFKPDRDFAAAWTVPAVALEPRPGVESQVWLWNRQDAGARPIAVERRVGRGRILMIGFNLTNPKLIKWPGDAELVRRLVLRTDPARPRSDLRYFSRDGRGPQDPTDVVDSLGGPSPGPAVSPGAWRDDAPVPSVVRDVLRNASGIEIPRSGFVAAMMAAYIVLLVPVNWLVCRVVLRRPEWAWVAAPLITLVFAIVIERQATARVGYASAAREIDLVEIHGGYPRAHLSRFTSIFSSSRRHYLLRYPDPSALALPFASLIEVRGQHPEEVPFHWGRPSELSNLIVHPHTVSMARAEQMLDLPDARGKAGGGIGIPTRSSHGRLVAVSNNTPWTLSDAWVVGPNLRASLGSLPPGTTKQVPVGQQLRGPWATPGNPPAGAAGRASSGPPKPPADRLNLNPETLLRLAGDWAPTDGDRYRLVAWMPRTIEGQEIAPPPDLQGGITIVMVHLAMQPLTGPDDLGFAADSHD